MPKLPKYYAPQYSSPCKPPCHPATSSLPETHSILLVDDDSSVREGLRRVLKTEAWNVISAASGEEALEYLQSHEPSLMITDLSMASVSGWDLLFHETLQRPTMPIFVITALPLGDISGADKFAHEFFQKPIDLELMLSAIHRHLRARAEPTPSAPTPHVSSQ